MVPGEKGFARRKGDPEQEPAPKVRGGSLAQAEFAPVDLALLLSLLKRIFRQGSACVGSGSDASI
jgi:hypothetical protein